MKYIKWVEEYSNKPPIDVICQMSVDDAIMLQKAKSKLKGLIYENDEAALKDFIIIRFAAIIESRE